MLELIEKLDPEQATTAAHLDTLVLPYDLRKRGRLKAVTAGGREVGLFLERGKVLASGDRLRARSGEIIGICSAPEPVITATAADDLTFARICYHLGNRHVPLQIGTRWLRLQPDHVLEALIRSYGLEVIAEEAPFEPENGAYGEHGGHRHGDLDPAPGQRPDPHSLFEPVNA